MQEVKHELLVDQFVAALSNHYIDRCEQILADLEQLAHVQSDAGPWSLYLTGILSIERDNDWASAERTYLKLLRQGTIDPQLQIRTLIALGIAYHYQGDWPQAINAFTRSLPISRGQGRTLDEIKALNEIAATYQQGFSHSDYDEAALHNALGYGEQALALLEPLDSERASQLEGMVLNNVGLIHESLGDWDSAIAYYERDLALSEAQGNRYSMGLSYGNLAEAWHHRGRAYWPHALNAYENALELIREAGNLYEEIEALTNLANLSVEMDDYALAINHFESAIALIESLRGRASSEEARAGFFATVVKTYAGAVNAYLASERPIEAFDVAERSRARTFIEVLADQPVREPERVPEQLVTEEQHLRKRLRALANQDEPDRISLAEIEQQWVNVQRRIHLLDAEYAAFNAVNPLTLDQIQQRLPEDAALIAYFTSTTKLLAFVVTRDELTVYPLALSPDELALAFDEQGHLHRLLPAADGRLREPWALGRLYAFLVAPLLEVLAPFARLYIVPHGQLHYVPFHALSSPDDSSHHLMDDFEVVYAPSATVLLDYCQMARPVAGLPGLTVGFNDDDLQHAESEAKAIARLVSGSALVGPETTQGAIQKNVRNQRLVHFACHGRFSASRPLASYLSLADGPLYVTDILRDFELQADLVTLSACETGRSQVRRGDELVGFIRALFYAGTPSVVVSLWPVDEISTRIMMEIFYGELSAGRSKGAALRNAQCRLRHMSDDELAIILSRFGIPDPGAEIDKVRTLTGFDLIFDHPYFWAPFFLVGDAS